MNINTDNDNNTTLENIPAIDIDFKHSSIAVIDIVEALKNDAIEYNKSVYSTPEILELILLGVPISKAIIYSSTSKTYPIEIAGRVHTFIGKKFYTCEGLVSTLQHYIVNDEVIDGFQILTDFNGKRYSELSRRYRRKIEETKISAYDISGTKYKNEIIGFYTRVMNSI